MDVALPLFDVRSVDNRKLKHKTCPEGLATAITRNVCVYVYIYTRIHIRIYIYVCISYIYIYICKHACLYTYIYICIHLFYMCIYVYLSLSLPLALSPVLYLIGLHIIPGDVTGTPRRKPQQFSAASSYALWFLDCTCHVLLECCAQACVPHRRSMTRGR